MTLPFQRCSQDGIHQVADGAGEGDDPYAREGGMFDGVYECNDGGSGNADERSLYADDAVLPPNVGLPGKNIIVPATIARSNRWR